MSTQEVFVEQFARLFVHYRAALAPTAEQGGSASSEAWQDAPQAERERMVAAGRLALMELESRDREDSRRWYARPGEAEWGC